MAQLKELVKSYFDQNGLKYQQHEKGFLTIGFTLNNIKDLSIILSFDDDNKRAELVSFSIGEFGQEKYAQGLIACNACNTKYRWSKFYIDDNNHICVRSDAILDEATCGEECMEVVQRMAGIIDDAYPVFMKARWA